MTTFVDTETPAEGCDPVASNFSCTGVGFYPAPDDCQVYYNCYKDADGNINAEPFSCDDGYVFDPNAANLMYCRYTRNQRCVTVDCSSATSTRNVAFAYSGNSQFVALCLVDADPLVFQCPTGTKPNLSNIPVSCTFTCPAIRLYPYSLDPLQYYNCHRDAASGRVVATLTKCPTGMTFVSTTCVRNPA